MNKLLTLEDKHRILLDIMTDIDVFCRENGIRYTISSGTLLGAVRHGGFIPWDDDADLFMLREDFDRFVSLYKGRRYHLLYNVRTEKEFFACGFAKVNDPSTFKVEKQALTRYGVSVDIFPLDAVPEDPRERQAYMHGIMRLHNRLYHRQHTDLVSLLKSRSRSLDGWWKACDDAVRSGKYASSPYVAHIVGTQNYRTVIDRSRFDTLGEITFEGRTFSAFSEPESYLALVYGPDWMTPPPPGKRISHGYDIYQAD